MKEGSMCLILDCWPATESGVVTQVGPGLQNTSAGILTGSGLSLGLGGQGGGLLIKGLGGDSANDTVMTR